MWKAMGNVWKVWRGVLQKKKQPPTPVRLPNKYTRIAHKDYKIVLGLLNFTKSPRPHQKKNTPPPTPVRFRSKSTVIAHKDDNSVVGFFIFLEYMIAFIQ